MGISKGTAEMLKTQGGISVKKRGQTFETQPNIFVAPRERIMMDNAGKESNEKRTNTTEKIMREYEKK